jgi:exodeoxyribonuclease (lambda-induced)
MPTECKHEQGTEAWHLDRLSVPTASMFKSIITATGKPSTSAKGYMNALLADWEAGKPVDAFEPTQAMQTGTEREAEARDLYQFITDKEVTKTGFWFKDKRKLTGCSPDGLLNDNGLIEIKCPKASTLIGYRLDNKCPSIYVPQVQGQMWVMDSEYCDFFVYHPEINHFSIRVERDEKYITTLSGLVNKFIDVMLEKRELLKQSKRVA